MTNGRCNQQRKRRHKLNDQNLTQTYLQVSGCKTAETVCQQEGSACLNRSRAPSSRRDFKQCFKGIVTGVYMIRVLTSFGLQHQQPRKPHLQVNVNTIPTEGSRAWYEVC
ncbi:hypothetical protein BaRGS_00013287 [Batillaria attramentaria]|uniref:Uncharacterized protein n=1 Tax=Batillaria attramentaria TaxID=370345 RepID=A0ABD0L861_9CAEN